MVQKISSVGWVLQGAIFIVVLYNDIPDLTLVVDVYPRNLTVGFAFPPGFDSRYKLDDDITMQYVCGDQFKDNIPHFALDCDDFCSHMCAVGSELETP